ncbi:hypothetical protein [uncultured Prevotella sp.]|uniref:hypothetical protein n=1 Tax=uncultured Prevotella sp. TaxID=159272 RepID=UPI0026701668|nr:hypothetical protein [uncultured Prevotella sp.]
MKKIFLLLLALLFLYSSKAEQKTTVVLKNGSVIAGNIIVQQPGTDLTIAATSARLVIEESNIVSKREKKVKYESLPREWKRWALENKALLGNADGRYIVLYDIKTKNDNFTNLAKVEQYEMPKVSYVQVEPQNYKLVWSDVNDIRKIVPKNQTENTIEDEVVTTKGKNYVGVIISQQIGKKITIKTSSSTVEVPATALKETIKLPVPRTTSLYKLADYVNTIVLNDGSTKEGVIKSQHYGKKDKEQYVVLQKENGTSEQILTSKVKEFRTDYKKQNVETYKSGYVYVNEFHIQKAKTRTEGDKVAFIDKKVFAFPEGITTTFKAVGAKFQGVWRLIALENLPMQNGEYTQGYDAEIRKNNVVTSTATDLVGGISSISFTYLSPGFYALVNEAETEKYIIKIKK